MDDSNNPYQPQRDGADSAADIARRKLEALYQQQSQTPQTYNPLEQAIHPQQDTPTPYNPPTDEHSHQPPVPTTNYQSYRPTHQGHSLNGESGQGYDTFQLPGTSPNIPSDQQQPSGPVYPQHSSPPIQQLYSDEVSLQNSSHPQDEHVAPDHQLPAASAHYSLPGASYGTQRTVPNRNEQIAAYNQASRKQLPTANNILEKLKSGWHKFIHGDDLVPGHGKPFLITALAVALMFVLYNNQIILGRVHYYISPGDQVVSQSITDFTLSNNVSEDPRIIIPKINVDVPVVYDEPSWDDSKVQKALERGVVHYGSTAVPGQNGNNVIVGHSSNSFWNSGKYKFAFVLLDRLENGDTFVLHYEGKRYIYEVFNKKIIEPTDVDILNQDYDEPITTLITCTPPGTAWRRLVVQARQISPDPAEATKAPNAQNIPSENHIPGETNSLLDNVRNWFQ